MRLLQRYILWELIRVFSLILGVLTFLLMFVGVAQEASASGLGPEQVLKILPWVVPSLLPFTIPATLLLTVCVVYGRMSSDQEITAAKAAGINVLSLLSPAILLGGILSVGSLILADQLIPMAVSQIQGIVTLAMEDIFLDMLRNNHQVVNKEFGLVVNVRDVRGKTLIMPTFRYSRPGGEPVVIQAESAELEFDLKKQHVILHMVHAQISTPDEMTIAAAQPDYTFPLPSVRRDPRARHLTINVIRKEIEEIEGDCSTLSRRRDMFAAMAMTTGRFSQLHEDGFRLQYVNPVLQGASRREKLKTELHTRFALSSSCLFFVLLGSTFSILQAKKQFLTNFLFCFAPILLLYYPVVLLLMNLSKTGSIEAWWSSWVANGLLLIAGLYVLKKLLKH
ncbi:MAG: LptF/LptG family permease [Planctomycetota bacterium]|nr:LptF/LptG family permease [Planctomycetota bacterium]MDA1213013.1 LptF/LptG family permease [Planctomycetota bacterium]